MDFKIIPENKNNIYKDSAIIPPPDLEKSIQNTKFYRYIIDSRDRNSTLYEKSSNYTIELDEQVTDVVSLELLNADVPFSRYLIHDKNNIFHYSLLSNPDIINEIEIKKGNYENANDLLIELNNALNSEDIIVTFDNITEKFTFTHNSEDFIVKCKGNSFKYSENEIDYKLKENSIANIIGFANKDYESESNELETPFIINLVKDNYLIITLDNCKINHGKSPNLESSFVLINNKDIAQNNSYDHQIRKTFNPPLNNLKRMRIKFKDYYGNEYDFQNQNHRLEVVFGSLKQTSKYNNIFQNT